MQGLIPAGPAMVIYLSRNDINDDRLLRVMAARVHELEEKLAQKNDLLREYEEFMSRMEKVLFIPKLTKIQNKIVLMIYNSRVPVNREKLHSMVYAQLDIDDRPEVNVISVHIHLIRRKIKPLGLSISTICGAGFFFSPEERKKLDDFVRIQTQGHLPGDKNDDHPSLV